VIREGYGFDGLHGVVEPMANSSLHVGFECNDLVFAALLASIGYACGSRQPNTGPLVVSITDYHALLDWGREGEEW
jgi:hypothetical protein